MSDDKGFGDLNDWLGDHNKGLYREIQDLMIARHVFREVHAMVDANPEIRDSPSTFWSWIDALYPTWASMVIRRLSAVPPRPPTFEQLDECIDFFEKALRKYVMLFRAVSGDILPTWGFDWMAIFKKPWLPQ
ncbi:MAG: hypothetical protein WCD12_00835 [Candidatus Binatus sp.]|uniref:hypothetical protein n=1 Tax=Candidatus Binatus sp. TaxID=2811406 RepID=UPI003C708A72